MSLTMVTAKAKRSPCNTSLSGFSTDKNLLVLSFEQ